MSKNIQIVKMSKNILEYFTTVMDLQNESKQYRETTINEFKDRLTKSLNCGIATKKIIWTK